MNDTLIVDEPRGIQQQPEKPNDLRHAMMTLPVEQQNKMLTEYVDRRNNFRRWLKEQLVEGEHFGFPPGCQPKPTKPKEWVAHPSLYAAGADLIIDLLALRSEFVADVAAWQQMGSPAETFVIVCKLFSRATGDLIGEGRGVRRVGQKGGDGNNAIKMAQKSARVDAVLNCYCLRDMFTQDLEVPSQPPHDNPEPDDKAPKATPRGKRQKPPATEVTLERIGELFAIYRGKHPTGSKEGDLKAWQAWVPKVVGRQLNGVEDWTKEDVDKCCRALGHPTPDEEAELRQ